MMSTETEAAIDAVMSYVTRERLANLLVRLVNIPSPTGAEAQVASWIVERLGQNNVSARMQHLDAFQANAVGLLPGGSGPSLLLYSPLDTFTTGSPDLDVPWMSADPRPDMMPAARVHDGVIEGLAAGNPKGHVAVVMAVAEALTASGVDLPGDVVLGFGAGGMPSFVIEGVGMPDRLNTGHGVGATFLLERGYTTDFAVIAKPGWTVSHEEVGLVWIDVEITGHHTYVGSRHRTPYRNAVACAGLIAAALDEWFVEYGERHEHETMKPQGIVAGVYSGPDRLAAATPAVVRLRLDVRLTTQQTAPEVVREVRDEVERLSRELGGVRATVEQVAYVPATRTDPDSPVVRATIEAMEKVSGSPHRLVGQNSGATDANILRMRGVPTARVGMPKVSRAPDGGEIDFTHGMNLADLADMQRLSEVLIRTVFGLSRYVSQA